MGQQKHVLSDDLEYIEEVLSHFGAYHFSEDLTGRMDALGLSSSALSDRCGVTHTMIYKWKTGQALPNGRERMKELGMALGMDEEALNTFLLQNGYPRLYVKNPLDGAARRLLHNHISSAMIVGMYRELAERLSLDGGPPQKNAEPLATAVMSARFREAVETSRTSGWFRLYQSQFVGDGKTQLPAMRLTRFLLLYIGDARVYELGLSPALKKILYPILSEKAVTVRFLREKLTAFGLYSNMTENEIDVMLECMKLRPLSEPVTRLDMALLTALRCAHARFPLYEYDNTQRAIERLTPPKDDFETDLLEEYTRRFSPVKKMTDYYNSHEQSKDEREFERRYTSYADRGAMDYVHDLLTALTGKGVLEQAESAHMLRLLKRNDLGESIWNTAMPPKKP